MTWQTKQANDSTMINSQQINDAVTYRGNVKPDAGIIRSYTDNNVILLCHPNHIPLSDPSPVKKLSVLIPMYRSGNYISEAVQSIVEQWRSDYELIIVDDGSDDNSFDCAWDALSRHTDVCCTIVAAPHKGQASARNTALSIATGEWIFYLDADDVLTPDALNSLLENSSGADGVCAMCRDFISPELTWEQSSTLSINNVPYRRMLSGCTIFRKKVYDVVGKFDETLASSETAQWMMRMKDCGFVVKDVDFISMKRRYHNNNFGRRCRQTQIESYMEIIRQRRKANREAEK